MQLQAFLQLIESGAQELLESYHSKQEAVTESSSAVLSLIEASCSKMLSEADTTYLALSDSVGDLARAVESVLAAQESYIRERREKEQKSLLNEVSCPFYRCTHFSLTSIDRMHISDHRTTL